MKSTKLPAKIYVRWGGDDSEDRFLLVTDDAAGQATHEEVRKVGVYELTEVVLVSAPVVIRRG